MLPRSNHRDHRRIPRINLPFPVIIRGQDATGDRFEVRTVLDELSPCDLSLRITRPLRLGSKLFVYIRLSTAPAQERSTPAVAMHGVVDRLEPQVGGYWRLDIAFDRHRFLYASRA